MNRKLSTIINSELCIGCGACTINSQTSMVWNKNGFLIPSSIDNLPSDAHKFCPFNLEPEVAVRSEDELANIFFKDAPYSHSKVGHYFNTYAGYSNEFRENSSSGGIATYIMCELLASNYVDYVVSVGEGDEDYYNYTICRTKSDVFKTSKTKYYPVSMSSILKEITNMDGRFAVVGTACFVKAIRLLQFYEPKFKDKIKFVIGIICGGQKSKFYADYLASCAGVKNGQYTSPNFRIKDYNSSASDYSFGCKDQGKEYQVKMKTLGDMWGSGLFKNNACDFCDDVTTELADISLGDAWLQPYTNNGRGTNVIVTRSELADKLIHDGIVKDELTVENLPFDRFLASQQGSFNHRHLGLGYRIKLHKTKDKQLPYKRFDKDKISIDFKLVQKQRLKVRKMSLELWSNNPNSFNYLMLKDLKKLQTLTRINHYIRAIKKKFLK